MKLAFCLATLVSIFALALAVNATVYQPVLVNGDSDYTSTVRIANLNFAKYDPSVTYTASFCEGLAPVVLITISSEYAVFRIKRRPIYRRCPLDIFDGASGKYAFQGPVVEFDLPRPNTPPTFAHDVVPSFFQGDSPQRTRVTVVAPFMQGVSSVAAVNGEGTCKEIKETADGFSCMLPFIRSSKIDPTKAIIFKATAPLGSTLFAVQGILDQFTFVYPMEQPTKIHNGKRFTFKLSRPLSSKAQYPWVPVLIGGVSDNPEPRAVFTNVVWSEDDTAITATVECVGCPLGAYKVSLGEAMAALSASLIPTAGAVELVEASDADADDDAAGGDDESGQKGPRKLSLSADNIVLMAAGAAALAVAAGVAVWQVVAARRKARLASQESVTSADEYITLDGGAQA